MQYFIESVLPSFLAVLALCVLIVAAIWMAAWKGATFFAQMRLANTQRRIELLRDLRITQNQQKAATLYQDAVAAMLTELSTKKILEENISQEVYGLLTEANAQRDSLPASTREAHA